MMRQTINLRPGSHHSQGSDLKARFEGMRHAGRLAASVLDAATSWIEPGMMTARLDALCHEMINDHGAVAAPLGYRGFPKATCISVNEEVCHGIPGERILHEGDILNLDVTVKLDGWHGDTSRMYFVGEVSPEAKRLCQVTYESMLRGIQTVRPLSRLGDIGAAIQGFAEAHGCSVVRDYCGHGIGTTFHQPPSVLHFGEKGAGAQLPKGLFFTVEPMINAGVADTLVCADGWTVITADRKLSAQFEHTIGITENGHEIFTLSPEGRDHPPW